MRRMIKVLIVVIVISVLFVSAIAGTILYYNGEVNQKNSQIASLNNQVANLSNQISNLTDQLIKTTAANENLTFFNFTGFSGLQGNGWNMTFILQNIGNATAIINNIIIDGQTYSSINPIPTVNPSIENGYALSPNQSVTITIHGSSPNPFHNGGKLYVLTAIGNSYLFYLSSGL